MATTFRATVHVLLPVPETEDWGDACDLMSAIFSDNLMLSGLILDWEYVPDEHGLFGGPTLVDLGGDEWDPERLIDTLPAKET